MGRQRFLFDLAGLLIIAFLVTGAPAGAADITISPGLNAIQNAINAGTTNPGDTLILTVGTYTEHDITVSKDIIIRADTANGHGPADTIIDAQTLGRIFDNSGGHDLAIDNLTLQNGAVTGDSEGGAIINYNGGTVTITGSIITGCTARYGGAISSTGTVTITGSTITSCSAAWWGGAIRNEGSTTITGSTITDCSAGVGGAIHNEGSTTITGSTITGCRAANGGAIYNIGGTFTITTSTITGCTAGGNGGAIWSSTITFTLTGTTITDCTATDSGGAIYTLVSTVTITTSTISGCTAGNNGGAIYSYYSSGYDSGTVTITGSTISGCRASSDGGVIFNDGDTVIIDSSQITGCTATGNGGAIYSLNSGTVTLTGSSITGCTASDNGGAIYNTNNGAVTIQGSSTISDCTTTGNGGAIYNDGGTVTITGSTFSGCSATSNGGTIYATGSGTVTIDTSGFTGNPSDYSANNGGAIYADSVTVSIDSTTFSDFSATQGGTIFTNGGTCTITATTFSGGWAGDDGGAIYNTGPLTITSSTFSGSGANMEGGAIENTGSLTVASSVFEDCRANNNGGAINNGGTLTMSGSTITGCTATNYGGAIHSSGHLTVTSSTFTGNAAAGGAGSAIYSYGSGSSIHFSRFYQNLYPVGRVVSSPTSVEAQDNWWGTSNNPNTQTMGYVNESPWLVLGITADPASIDTSGTSAIRTNLTYNKTAGSHPVGDTSGMGHVPDGITNTFAMVSGSGAVLPLTDGTANGGAQTTFTPLYGETVNISGTVDDQIVYIELPVAQTAPVPTGITPDTGVNISGIAITNLAGSSFTIIGTTDVVLMRTGYTNITATGVTVVDNTQITCTLPITGAEAGPWNVVVTNPDGQEGILANGFTITAPAPTTVPTAVFTTYHPDDDSGNTLSDFPSSAFPLMTVTVNIGGGSKAWQAIVTGTKLSDLIVTGTVQSGTGGNSTAPPGIVFQYISLVPARYNTITNAVINFTVPQSWLDENHIDPTSIVLYRLTANGWEALPTTVLYTKDGTVYFSAVSPGFSLFAIAGTPTELNPPGVAATQEIVSTPAVQEQVPALAAVAKAPVITQTTAPPVPSSIPAGSSPFPVVPALIGIGCVGLIGGGWYARRWWIRRQNPALFAEYD